MKERKREKGTLPYLIVEGGGVELYKKGRGFPSYFENSGGVKIK